MKVQILGPGCPKCEKVHDLATRAIHELGVDAEIVKITDITEILGFGVMMTPALAIDGVVKVVGKVPSLESIKSLLGGDG